MLAGEVRAAISGANSEVEAALSQLQAAKQRAEIALQALMVVRETSVDPIGIPELQRMIELIDEASVLGMTSNNHSKSYMPHL